MSNKIVLTEEGKAIPVRGVGIIFKFFAEDTGGSFGLIEHPIEPYVLGAPPDRHQDEDENS